MKRLFSLDGKLGVKALGKMRSYKGLLAHLNLDFPSTGSRLWSRDGIGYRVSNIGKTHLGRHDLFAIEAGALDSGALFIILSGHHGEETAGPMATGYIINELLNPTDELSDLLKSIRVAVIPAIDPEGYDWSARASAYNSGKGHFMGRRNRAMDINASWSALHEPRQPVEIKATKKFMQRFFDTERPKYITDLHETVPGKKDRRISAPIAGTTHALELAGPLLIESCDDQDVGDAMVQQLIQYGGKPFPFNRKTKFLEGISIVPQLVMFAPGRSKMGPLMDAVQIRVCTSYAHDIFGANGITIETFLKPLDQRVAEHTRLIEGELIHLGVKYS